jgi:hypothetical protein
LSSAKDAPQFNKPANKRSSAANPKLTFEIILSSVLRFIIFPLQIRYRIENQYIGISTPDKEGVRVKVRGSALDENYREVALRRCDLKNDS